MLLPLVCMWSLDTVSRVFEAPLSFLKTLNHATLERTGNFEVTQIEMLILGGNMSALELSH